MTSKVAIAIEAWKLDIFDRHLTAGGFTYDQTDGPEDTLILSVTTDDVRALEDCCRAAQTESAH